MIQKARYPLGVATPQMLSVIEAAAALSLHPQTIRGMIKRKKIAAVQIGRHWKIPVSAIENFEAIATERANGTPETK